MAPKCKICYHPQRENIETAILTGIPIRIISDQYGVSLGTINRHKQGHIAPKLAKSHEAREVVKADNLMETTKDLLQWAKDLTTAAQSEKDLKTALMGIGKIKDILELLLKVTGELEENKTEVNIINAPILLEIRTTIFEAIKPYPEARLAVSHALEEFKRGNV